MADKTATEPTDAFEQFFLSLNADAQVQVIHSMRLVLGAKSKSWRTRRMRELLACMERVAA